MYMLTSIAIGIVLTQPGDGAIDHSIAFASQKPSTTEKNYTTTKREGLANGLCTTKIQTLSIGWTLQNVHGPFCAKVHGQ